MWVAEPHWGGRARTTFAAMLISDQYAVAVAHGAAADVLAAAGMVTQRHQLGMSLQRLRVERTPDLLAAVHAALVRRLAEAQRRRLVRLGGQRSEQAVSVALGWWLDPTCEACGGVRWRAKDHRLTGSVCPACHGSGLRELEGLGPRWVLAQVELAVSKAEAAHRWAVDGPRSD